MISEPRPFTTAIVRWGSMGVGEWGSGRYLLGGGEAADAEREEDPAARVAALVLVLAQLLADHAVDLVSETRNIQSGLHKLKLLIIF